MRPNRRYGPQTAQIPAESLRADTRDTRSFLARIAEPVSIPNSTLLIPNWIRHPDHLGSSSWITYFDGSAVQHLHYLPWGEDFVDQRSTSWNAMYTFSAKEKDTETGYSYFGARYYSSDLNIWLSVDPMSDKYASLSPYVYCADNPVKLVDPNGEEYDGYEGSNGQYKWFDNHSEQSFSENGVKWTKVTENKSDWDEATAIRDANVEGLVSLGFDRSQAERDVRLYEGDNPLFTKESQLNNANKYTGSWESSYNSGGETAYESPEIKNTGYSLKYYPTKNGGEKALGIVKRGILGHGLEGGLEWLERKVYKQKADSDPLYDMHYRNARGLLKALRNSKIDISAPPTIYSNYHKSGGGETSLTLRKLKYLEQSP